MSRYTLPSLITHASCRSEMVQANYGSSGFVMNGINENEYQGGDDGPAMGKQKRGGVGGRGSKSNNHLEAKKANQRRNEKREREENKAQERARNEWL